jgi:Icc protein
MNRRELLRSVAIAGASGSLALKSLAATPQQKAAESFRFLFFTDTHIQPELNAAEGCRIAFAKMVQEPVDFAICGGDLIFDGLAVGHERANLQWDLYHQTSSALHVPVHYTVGNHDIFGLSPKSGIATNDPEYGRKAFQDRYGSTHYSFDHKGWHFVVLDSIGLLDSRTYIGQVGAEQIEWLKADLARIGSHRPVIVVTHIPLVTGAVNYVSRAEWKEKTANVGSLVDSLMVTDAAEVIDVLLQYNVRVVLQGHTHVNEDIQFRGIRFVTSGAVSGNWWRGTRAGSAEGYSVMTVAANETVVQRYVPYGFRAVTT